MPWPLKTKPLAKKPTGKRQRVGRHLFHLGSIHAFPTIQPDLPMQGGGLVHLCARGTRSGLQRSQRWLGVLQPKRGSSPNIGFGARTGSLSFRSSNGVFESSIAQKKFCWHLPLKAGALFY
ncbi:hypothetical protein L211DRAFT_832655 [Terfezia boudieri ATCC MYA-4762]|uniref:Uncharacterized protein n=1 Tax=Terfezia boudieri ATCC MYA-4762 TaxID=1051890 RepID=A0A3N4M7E6_9PEZI|nr:hypothetical protein L211DRAFT_832655 [Terfezia boudieri ATCC MYA-4762]